MNVQLVETLCLGMQILCRPGQLDYERGWHGVGMGGDLQVTDTTTRGQNIWKPAIFYLKHRNFRGKCSLIWQRVLFKTLLSFSGPKRIHHYPLQGRCGHLPGWHCLLKAMSFCKIEKFSGMFESLVFFFRVKTIQHFLTGLWKAITCSV